MTAMRQRRAPANEPRGLDLVLQYAVPRASLPARSSVARWIAATRARRATVTIRFVGRKEARRLNRIYRGRDYATNILTFSYGTMHGRAIAGDIVLCAPVVAQEARTQRKQLRAHYAHLTVHGMLHLRGHDHERPRAAARMEQLEIGILRRLGYANPYCD